MLLCVLCVYGPSAWNKTDDDDDDDDKQSSWMVAGLSFPISGGGKGAIAPLSSKLSNVPIGVKLSSKNTRKAEKYYCAGI